MCLAGSGDAGTLPPTPGPPIVVTLRDCYNPTDPEASEGLLAVAKANPRLELQQWGGISLPGGSGRAPLLMSIAGGTAPDIFLSWWHIIDSDIRQGFLYPLNEWVGTDDNGDGLIDDREARWPGWRTVSPLWRHVATRNGKVNGIPVAGTVYLRHGLSQGSSPAGRARPRDAANDVGRVLAVVSATDRSRQEHRGRRSPARSTWLCHPRLPMGLAAVDAKRRWLTNYPIPEVTHDRQGI